MSEPRTEPSPAVTRWTRGKRAHGDGNVPWRECSAQRAGQIPGATSMRFFKVTGTKARETSEGRKKSGAAKEEEARAAATAHLAGAAPLPSSPGTSAPNRQMSNRALPRAPLGQTGHPFFVLFLFIPRRAASVCLASCGWWCFEWRRNARSRGLFASRTALRRNDLRPVPKVEFRAKGEEEREKTVRRRYSPK